MLIGICGRAHHGKDSLANFFCNRGFQRYSFARPLKQAAQVMFGWDDRHTDGALKEVVDPYYGFSPRFALQTLGTEWGRNILREDIWIKVAEQRASTSNLVIPDVRFDNEAEFVLRTGILIHIVRPGVASIAQNHASETGIRDSFIQRAVLCMNSGTFDNLDQFADSVTNNYPVLRNWQQKLETK